MTRNLLRQRIQNSVIRACMYTCEHARLLKSLCLSRSCASELVWLQDMLNQLSVVMAGTFEPQLAKWVMKQEGWRWSRKGGGGIGDGDKRLSFGAAAALLGSPTTGADLVDKLEIQGVVYNEMKAKESDAALYTQRLLHQVRTYVHA
eukprot:GHVU01071487.1.p3 GENE.GHVU01071487.1~~GHVU01071487.1.p3  ORF type:complete len:147 (+),score=14.85 GHVU01071487.1:1199-1639(+)